MPKIFAILKPENKAAEFDYVSRIAEIRKKIDSLYSCYNILEDPDMIEYCVLELKALEAEYTSLLRKVKSEHVVAPINNYFPQQEKKSG